MSYETGTASNWLDLMKKVVEFVTLKGTAFGLAYSGTGNGPITGLRGGANAVAETFTVQFADATNFSVTGSVSGALAAGTVGTPYADAGGHVEFTIAAGGVAFVNGDTFTFSTAPKWTANRVAYGPKSYTASHANTGNSAPPNLWDGVHGPNTSDTYRGYDTGSGITFPVTIEIEFFEAETIAEYALAAFNSGSSAAKSPRDWTLQYWNGSAWTTLDTRSGQTGWVANEVRTYTIASPVSATRYRLHITAAGDGTSQITLKEWMLRRAAGGFNALFSQALLKAPGNDGNSEFHVGLRSFFHAGADYYNVAFIALDGYTAAAEFWNQPGLMRNLKCLPGQNANMAYWIFANGRHLKVVAKIGSQYECAYLGAYDPFFPPSELPYPLAVGASMHPDNISTFYWDAASSQSWNDAAKFRYDRSDYTRSAFTHSDTGSGSDTSYHPDNANLVLRHFDGAYIPFYARRAKSAISSLPTGSQVGVIWPVHQLLDAMDPNLDGSYTLFPVLLLTWRNNAPNPMGQLDGVAWVTGQGIGAESVVDQGPRRWIVFPDWNRSTRESYWAAECY